MTAGTRKRAPTTKARAAAPKRSAPQANRPRRVKESREAKSARALVILERLAREFPDAHCALDHGTPHQLLVATILSAQCTDARVNLVTKDLFRKYPDVAAFARASLPELEQDVRSTGFFRMKARAIVEMSGDVLTTHGGRVPGTMQDLVKLRGVGRKTANVVLGNAYGVPGVVVDTHVGRLAVRLALTRERDPVKVERELAAIWPSSWWTLGSHLLILHGRKTCAARRPKCGECPIRDLCPSADVV